MIDYLVLIFNNPTVNFLSKISPKNILASYLHILTIIYLGVYLIYHLVSLITLYSTVNFIIQRERENMTTFSKYNITYIYIYIYVYKRVF